MRTAAIVVAAGTGSRAGRATPKQFEVVRGRPVIAHAVDALRRHPGIDDVQVVIGAGQEALCAAALPGIKPVIGGAERRDSVLAGLAATNAEQVLVHDAARPFLPVAVVDRLLAALEDAPAAVPVLPIVDTLARGTDTLGETVPREALWRVQTPQAFRADVLRAAHATWTGGPATDDAQVVRAAGHEVRLVPGDRRLEKLTMPDDYAGLAGPDIRTGSGYDVHALVPGDHVWLCGVRVPHDRALSGHSDADVGLHALTDALLGAIGDGDIGHHFPPSDPQWRGAASHLFLSHAAGLLAARGGRVLNVDVTLICEAPKVGPHRAAMRAELARLLDLAEDRVSVKATTTERLGFTGRGEGIAAQAVATVILEPAC